MQLQCGVIECVPNAKSRDQMGRSTEVDLFAYFKTTYGDESSIAFQQVNAIRYSFSFLYLILSFSLCSYVIPFFLSTKF